MDPGSVVVQLVGTLAIPVTVIALAVILKADVGHVLRRVRALRYKGGAHELDLQLDSGSLEQAAREALPPAKTADALTGDELTTIALAVELTRDVVYVADNGPNDVRLVLADGAQIPISRSAIQRGFAGTPEVLEAVLKHRSREIGSFTLAAIKSQVEAAIAHWDRVQHKPHPLPMSYVPTLDNSDIVEGS